MSADTTSSGRVLSALLSALMVLPAVAIDAAAYAGTVAAHAEPTTQDGPNPPQEVTV